MDSAVGTSRVVIIGNSGGGKSTLARALAAKRGLRHIEVDRLLWQEGWIPTPTEVYDRTHDDATQGVRWVMDGLGQQASIPRRLALATEIVLVDMPLWMHFWLAAERQIAWASGKLDHAPGGVATSPPTEALFRTIWTVDLEWLPKIRQLCSQAEVEGAILHRLTSVADLDAFHRNL